MRSQRLRVLRLVASRSRCSERPRLHRSVILAKALSKIAVQPCTAWINETLCKLIYVNLRLTVEREIHTGYRMNYMRDTFFPAIPKGDRLIE